MWTHLALVFDAATNRIRLYGVFAVGRTKWNGAANSWFAGEIDNVRAYEGALSDADVANLYNQ